MSAMEPEQVFCLTRTRSVHNLMTFNTCTTVQDQKISCVIQKAYEKGVVLGSCHAGQFFSGFIGLRNHSRVLNEDQALFQKLGYGVGLITAIGLICLSDLKSGTNFWTICIIAGMLFTRILNGLNMIVICSYCAPKTFTGSLLVASSAMITAAKHIDPQLAQKFGELSRVQKIFGSTCGILCAATAGLSWSCDRFKLRILNRH